MDIITLAAAKKYTDNTVIGGGAIKGKNCTIDSITAITGGHRITFKWTLDDGTEQTSTLDVMDGEKGDKGDKGSKGDTGATGEDGVSITEAEIDEYGHLILTFSDGEVEDVGQVSEGTTVVANPSETATDELNSIQIGNTVYDLGGSGGTTVVANPSGTPTDDLNSIQIGNDIYRIVGSGGGGDAKALVMKTKTWTGNGDTSSLVLNFDEKPLAIFNIFGVGLNGTNVLAEPFMYGKTNYMMLTFARSGQGLLINNVAYSNDDLTMTITGVDVGAIFNVNNAEYTMWYIVEEEVGGGSSASWKDITGTLTAGQTEITLADPIINSASTFESFTDKFGVNPTNMEIIPGAESILQPLVESESELLGTVTVSSIFASYSPWKAFTSAGAWVAEGNIDQWLAYEFPTDVIVSKIQWNCDDGNRRGIVTSIQYSNDGTTWNDCTLSTNERGNVEISGANNAKHWRLFFAAPFGSWTEPMISNLKFITIVNGVKLTFPVQSENINVKVRIS